MSSRSSRISNTASTHIRGLCTKGTDVDSRKASAINVDTLGMQPIVTRFTAKVSRVLSQLHWKKVHH